MKRFFLLLVLLSVSQSVLCVSEMSNGNNSKMNKKSSNVNTNNNGNNKKINHNDDDSKINKINHNNDDDDKINKINHNNDDDDDKINKINHNDDDNNNNIKKINNDDGDDDVEWGYDDNSEVGPSKWFSLRHDWGICKGGREQSPIDIVNVVKNKKMGKIAFDFDEQEPHLRSNGNYLEWLYHGRTRFNGRSYNLTGVTFHSPSEHRIRGISFPLEAQFIHKHASHDKDLVVSVLFVNGPSNDALSPFWYDMPRFKGESIVRKGKETSAMGIIPKNVNKKGYYYYRGSQTRPPCRENVSYIVLKGHPSVSVDQVDFYKELYGKTSARPVQKIFSRKVQGTA